MVPAWFERLVAPDTRIKALRELKQTKEFPDDRKAFVADDLVWLMPVPQKDRAEAGLILPLTRFAPPQTSSEAPPHLDPHSQAPQRGKLIPARGIAPGLPMPSRKAKSIVLPHQNTHPLAAPRLRPLTNFRTPHCFTCPNLP